MSMLRLSAFPSWNEAFQRALLSESVASRMIPGRILDRTLE